MEKDSLTPVSWPVASWPYWHNLLTSKGLEGPSFYAESSTVQYYVFCRGPVGIFFSTASFRTHSFPKIQFRYRGKVLAQIDSGDELENILELVEALCDPDRLVICIAIPWAGALLEALVKHVDKEFECQTT